MSGSLVDLSQPGVDVPDLAVIDTNVVVAYFRSLFAGQLLSQSTRAARFFESLLAANRFVIMPPTAFGELLHLAVKEHYTRHVQVHRQALRTRYGVPVNNWLDLYKQDPTILQDFHQNLTLLREGLMNSNVIIAEPADLQPHRSPMPFAQQLIDRMTRYGLDTSDALILMEAKLLGIDMVVTMDRDMQRAIPDFTVYTWI